VWTIEFAESAAKSLSKLEPAVARRITRFLRERLATSPDPRKLGAALKGGELGEFWKYRVGDFRIIADIQDHRVRILVVRVGNRKDVYR
jgi:mRNA interferase RelE/StbE